MSAGNTKGCFTEFIGQKVEGVLFDACPPQRSDIAKGTKTLIFEDGRGLTISSKGTYWVTSKEDVRWALKRAEEELRDKQAELANVLFAAGRSTDDLTGVWYCPNCGYVDPDTHDLRCPRCPQRPYFREVNRGLLHPRWRPASVVAHDKPLPEHPAGRQQ